MNLLAIGAHPDDIEFGCAAILIREIQRGNCLRLLVLSRGEAGSAGTPEIREQEARNAARVMGAASVDFLDFGGDCHFQDLPANSFQIAAKIREYQPAIVLAPHTLETQHPDHAVAGKLARDACRLARYGGLNELKPTPPHKVANLFFYHITQHLDRPDVVIDIGSVMAQWEEAMRCHQTQVKNKSYLELQKAGARQLGLSIGVEYAAGLYLNDPLRLEHLSDLALSARNF